MSKLPTSVTDIIGDHIHKQKRGWCVPYLIGIDEMPGVGHGRWDYWLRICATLELPDEPIPHVGFVAAHQIPPVTRAQVQYPDQLSERPDKHIQRILHPYICKYGGWYDDAWLQFVRWLLHGFGAKGLKDEVERIPGEIRSFWYTQFNLAYLLSVPIDWSVYILQSGPQWMGNGRAKWSRSTAFFSTPMNVCTLMTEMTMPMTHEDTRAQKVCDPCVGTGSMLLPASNYSLRLYGQDIVYDLVLCTMLNGYLWAPWMVYMPPEVDEMLEQVAQQHEPGPVPQPGPMRPAVPIVLETRPEKVAATQAYREGRLEQVGFFAEIGL